MDYRISLVIRRIIFLPKPSQRSRSVLKDGSRSLALFRKGKIGIIAKFHRTDLVICSHSRGTKNPSYRRKNTVISYLKDGQVYWLKRVDGTMGERSLIQEPQSCMLLGLS